MIQVVSCVQILMRYWQPVTGAPCLWSVRHAPWSIWFPLLCFSLHFLCWAIICSILMIFDYTELLGIKQVTRSYFLRSVKIWLNCSETSSFFLVFWCFLEAQKKI